MTDSSAQLYIQMFSIHGLVRLSNMQLGYDADTGGQVKYVIELGKALSRMDNISRVDLFTRKIDDAAVSEDYGRQIETYNDKFRIVRIPCGGPEYIRKEKLWPSLDEFVENTRQFNKEHQIVPDVVHGHYADAGIVAEKLARAYSVPLLFTGHSLGRAKKERLMGEGADEKALNQELRIDHRIEMEEQVLERADLVIASTRHEIETQYGAYHNGGEPEFKVIPPGVDIDKFQPFYHEDYGDEQQTEKALFARTSLFNELDRFFQVADKPLILMLCRPDRKKNIEGMIRAYGEDPELQAIANLAVFAGIRKDIREEDDGARKVLTQMLMMMDRYNLYGKLAIPKKHDFENEVPELYRIAAERRGVFVNPALTEPFGITLIEASACGLPVVATNEGGPVDILENCKSGVLVDPGNIQGIAGAVKDILVHPEKWDAFSKNGILNTREHYTWESHSNTYTSEVSHLVKTYDAT